MIDFTELEVVNLYLLLSETESLSVQLESSMLKLEREVFELYTVKEIEGYRAIFNNKGKF